MFSANTLLEKERIKKSISMRKLTKGICSHQLLIKATNGDTNIELLTFEILLERVGRSPEYLEFVLSEKEYSDVLTRDKIDELIYSHDYCSAKKLLDQYIPDADSASLSLKMYYYRILAWISEETGDFSRAKEYILQAIYTTLPGITLSNYDKYLFSLYEYENILMLCKTLFLSGKSQDAALIVETIYKNVLSTISDQWLTVSVLPKCAYLLSEYARKQLSNETLICYCEESIELMRNEGILYMMLPLLNNLINLYIEENNSEKVSFWTPYKDAINELLSEYAPNLPQDSIYFHWKRASYNLDTEIIRAERLRLNLSQEELAEGIFSASNSVSLLETKKCSPNKSNYSMIMDRIGINKPRRSSFVLTESFERLELFLELRNAATKFDYKTILSLIDTATDFSPEEIDAINAFKCVAYKTAIQSNDSKYIENSLSSFAYDFSLPELSVHNRKPLLIDSYVLIPYLLFEKEKNIDTLMPLFKNYINAFHQSQIDLRHSYCSYIIIANNYISAFKKRLLQDEIIALNHNLLSCSILSGNGAAVSTIFWALVCASFNHFSLNPAIYKNAYLFAELYKETTATYFKDYYMKNYHNQD